MGYSHEQVSHVYLRDDNGRSVLDVILQKNGEVTKVLEVILNFNFRMFLLMRSASITVEIPRSLLEENIPP